MPAPDGDIAIDELKDFDWGATAEPVIREMHRQAEVCLQGTVSLAVSQDQRSTVLCGVFGAAAVALMAAVATLATAASPKWSGVVAGSITALLLMTASILCGWAARPTDFYVAGYEPKLLIGVASHPDVRWILGYATRDLQLKIDQNRLALIRAGRWTLLGLLAAAAAVEVGTAALVVTAFEVVARFS